MALTKFASFEVSEVLDIKSSPKRSKTASLRTLSDFHDYREDDGYLYVRIRAISSRTNKNHDGWPTAELAGGKESWEKHTASRTSGEGFTVEASKDDEYGFSTFIGKPIFVDHHNSNPERARGVIADSKFNVLDQKTAAADEYWSGKDVDPEHNPPAEVELLLEVDAKSFPKFAESITSGDLDGFSMGCDVDYSKCSHCDNEASSPDEFCDHIVMKGAEHTYTSGAKAGKTGRSYENCYGIKFFEISGVFDPADETALTKEVRSAVVKEAGGLDVLNINDLEKMMTEAEDKAREAYISGDQKEGHYWGNKYHDIADQIKNLTGTDFRPTHDPHQGSYLASRKQAEADEPQAFKTRAPEDVDTLRKEKICPLCGSDMDVEKCAVCGYEEPPEQFQNPDLTQAQQTDELTDQADGQVDNPMEPGSGGPGQEDAETYLKARNPPATASVNYEMRWSPSQIDKQKVAAAIAAQSGDEPNEIVTSDQTKPVTSTFRTAQELIAAAAKRNQEKNTMSNTNKVAADPADASGKPDKQVDVEGVGGVMDASNEQASKPTGPEGQPGVTVDVEGKGAVLEGTNEQAAKPSVGTENVETKGQEQLGDKTQTWSDGKNKVEKSAPGVTDKAVQSAKQGVDPIDKSGKPDARVNVEEEVKYNNPQTMGIDQWTGTGGNGVTKQQDPVTKKVDPNIEQPRSSGFVSVAALKLADTEVELGITPKEDKYNRLAELADLSDAEIAAEGRALAKVKTAGLTRTASRGGVSRLPSFSRVASEAPAAPQPVDDALLDNALFSR